MARMLRYFTSFCEYAFTRSLLMVPLLLMFAPLQAKAVPMDWPLLSAIDKGKLAPGQFVWLAEADRGDALIVVVSLPQQLAYVYRDGTLIALSTISSGRRGYATPTGIFPILQKARKHASTLYDSAPMPFMQRLTWDGVALHGGDVPGYPASHGCVRLPMEFSRALFATSVASVVVTDEPVVEGIFDRPAAEGER